MLYFVGLNTVNRTEMTPRAFAESIMNSLGDSIMSGTNIPTVIPDADNSFGDVPENDENISNDVVDNENVATKSE